MPWWGWLAQGALAGAMLDEGFRALRRWSAQTHEARITERRRRQASAILNDQIDRARTEAENRRTARANGFHSEDHP